MKWIVPALLALAACGPPTETGPAPVDASAEPEQQCQELLEDYCHRCFNLLYQFCDSRVKADASCQRISRYVPEHLSACQADSQQISCQQPSVPKSCRETFVRE